MAHIPQQRSFAMHQRAAEILSERPERLAEALRILDHWAKLESQQTRAWAVEWRRLISGLSVPQVCALIVQQSELMDFYRKNSPFPCLLSPAERIQIINKHRFKHE